MFSEKVSTICWTLSVLLWCYYNIKAKLGDLVIFFLPSLKTWILSKFSCIYYEVIMKKKSSIHLVQLYFLKTRSNGVIVERTAHKSGLNQGFLLPKRLVVSYFRPQIREQMLGGTFLWYEKSILGYWLWVGLGCEIKDLGRLWATFEGGFFNFLWAKIK